LSEKKREGISIAAAARRREKAVFLILKRKEGILGKRKD